MKNIKKFDEYVKEELSPDTYVDIARDARNYAGGLSDELVSHAAKMRSTNADSRPQWVRELESYMEGLDIFTILTRRNEYKDIRDESDVRVVLSPPSKGKAPCLTKNNGKTTIEVQGAVIIGDHSPIEFEEVIFYRWFPRAIARIIFNNFDCKGENDRKIQNWRQLWNQA